MSRSGRWSVVALAPLLPALFGCGSAAVATYSSRGTADAEPTRYPVSNSSSDSAATLIGAADVAECGSDRDEATAHIVDSLVRDAVGPVRVFIAGDLVYPRGTRGHFARCYEPSWGRFKAITNPVPGNHEYQNGFLWFVLGGHADPYFEYFDSMPGQVGTPGDGWYHYEHGVWDVYALNTGKSGRIRPSSRQWAWLESELEANDAGCSLVYMHHPRFGTGKHGDNEGLRELWELLARHGVDVWLAGHDHSYQRFLPQTSTGDPDEAGIRQFIAGTGGSYLHPQRSETAGLFERRTSEHHGVLKLTLRASTYDWEFVLADGTVWDRGVSTCQNTRSTRP